jgi:hypothetical protein
MQSQLLPDLWTRQMPLLKLSVGSSNFLFFGRTPLPPASPRHYIDLINGRGEPARPADVSFASATLRGGVFSLYLFTRREPETSEQ